MPFLEVKLYAGLFISLYTFHHLFPKKITFYNKCKLLLN